jgi:hypothetical protein
MPEVLDANRMETVVFVELCVTWPVQNGDCGVCGALCAWPVQNGDCVVFVELCVTWPVQNGDCGVCGALCDVAGTEWRLCGVCGALCDVAGSTVHSADTNE